jgi:oxygen-dependent protoporphyrinogen oxidase
VAATGKDSVLVIGGGISGLSAAWFLRRRGRAVRVLESQDRVGGVISSERRNGRLIELGPNSTLQKPGDGEDALGRLVAETGLSGQLVTAAPAADNRFVMRGGRLHALPASPFAFLASPLFSWPAKLRLLGEPFVGRGKGEETIAAFAERRLGREFLDYAVAPFVSGVYAGDPRVLSVRAAVPKVYDLKRRYGSLIVGAIARGAKGMGGPAGRLVSFDGGMATLPETIAGKLAAAVRTGCRVVALARRDGAWEARWRSATGAGVERARHVVVALPADAAADVVEPLSPEAAGLLRAIPYAPIVTAAVAYRRRQVGHPLDGFGFLVPRGEDAGLLGGLFSSTLFAGRAPAGTVLLTAFTGGATDPRAMDRDDETLTRRIAGDLARILDIKGTPLSVRLSRQPRAIPQYTLGHLERVARIEALLAPLGGLYLGASWRGGISVADCIRNGESLAARVA